MKSLNPQSFLFSRCKAILLLLPIAFISINCEHCDDEDYTRDQKEESKNKNELVIAPSN
jgi:hypothetical protein